MCCFTKVSHCCCSGNQIKFLCFCSCTRGNVYLVFHLVPKSHDFTTYNSIRLHWKKHVRAVCRVFLVSKENF